MAHEIEEFSDGTAAFASARKPAWHQLGTVTDDCMTAQEVLKAAKLDNWNVRTLPLFGVQPTLDDEIRIPAPNHRMTARINPVTKEFEPLGVVSDSYVVIQNEECCELLNELVDSSGAHFETAGSLKEGKQVFITMKLPDSMTLAGIDTELHETYIALTTSHDGSRAARIDVTPVRIVCANTQRMALQRSLSHVAIRHSKNANRKMSQARTLLELTFEGLENFQTDAERLINTTMTDSQFNSLIDEVWPMEEDVSKQTKKAAEQRHDALHYLFSDSATQMAVRGTAWAGLQAITEYIDHKEHKDPIKHASNVLFGYGGVYKERARKAITI